MGKCQLGRQPDERQENLTYRNSENFCLYVRVHAPNGSDYYLQYLPGDGSTYPSGSYAFIPVGSQYRDGT